MHHASFAILKFWIGEFKYGRKHLENDERWGRPKIATASDTITKVHQMMPDDRRIKVKKTVEAVKIFKKHVCHILNQNLG